MVYAVPFDDEIRVWWDDLRTVPNEGYYQVFLNGRNCIYTKEIYYDFKNLQGGVEYDFCIKLLDRKGCLIGNEQVAKFSTLPAKARLDVTQEPYNAVGDGKTDNTKNLQLAFKNCKKDEYIYFPMGTYICGSLKMSGEVKMRFDAGATLCNSKHANR